MHVVVTGSREFQDRQLVWRVLDDLYEASYPNNGILLRHGACPTGADKHADDWARERLIGPYWGSNVVVVRHPANWSHGNGAGMARNAEMVKAGADLVVAFYAPPPARNKGTAGCVKLARRAGIEVREYGRETPATTNDHQETLPL